MKVQLMQRYADTDLSAPLPDTADIVTQDLELDSLFDSMARGDEFLRDVARTVLLRGCTSPDEIRYRQDVLRDCIENPEVIRSLYDLSLEGLDTRRKAMLYWVRSSPDAVLAKSLDVLGLLFGVLERMRALADASSDGFRSDGFVNLMSMLASELDDTYLREVRRQLRELRFVNGAHLRAELGHGNVGTGYQLLRPLHRRLLDRVRSPTRSHSFSIAPRDEHGMAVVAEMRARGINRAADALAQSVDHILAFFTGLRSELGFYVGCLNLYEQLGEAGVDVSFPEPRPLRDGALACRSLVDAPLALHLGASAVGNDVAADGVSLVVVTGANQGGKSTFLRSLGVAQLMMQAGMFVTARSFTASVAAGVLTHFRREEDVTMTHGKFDEELARMSDIVDRLEPGVLLLCNESFAATNEREGSEIAGNVVRAVVDGGVRVVYVTHLYDLASDLSRRPPGTVLFLRAEREDDGRRTFRVTPGDPLPTSYGADSYRRIFGAELTPVGATAGPGR